MKKIFVFLLLGGIMVNLFAWKNPFAKKEEQAPKIVSLGELIKQKNIRNQIVYMWSVSTFSKDYVFTFSPRVKNKVGYIDNLMQSSAADNFYTYEQWVRNAHFGYDKDFRVAFIDKHGRIERMISKRIIASEITMPEWAQKARAGERFTVDGQKIEEDDFLKKLNSSVELEYILFIPEAEQQILQSWHVKINNIESRDCTNPLVYPNTPFVIFHDGQLLYESDGKFSSIKVLKLGPIKQQKE